MAASRTDNGRELRGLSQMQGIPHQRPRESSLQEEDQPVIFALIMVGIALVLWWLA